MAQLKNLIVNGTIKSIGKITAPEFNGNLTGTANKSKVVLDSGDNSDITVSYSKAGISSPAWFAAWNSRELRAISAANTLCAIKALPLAGGTMSGNIYIPNINSVVRNLLNSAYLIF